MSCVDCVVMAAGGLLVVGVDGGHEFAVGCVVYLQFGTADPETVAVRRGATVPPQKQ